MNTAVGSVQIPRCAVADIVVELKRLILREHTDGIDTGVYTVGKREINNSVLAAVGYGRFCDVLGKDAESAALTACKKHRYTFSFF